MLNIVILDDIPAQASNVGQLVTSYISAPHHITQLHDNGAYKQLLTNGPAVDIVLMDINLGDESENGIELAKLTHEVYPMCQIIFISEYTRYVSAVYETEHLYFVTKSDVTHWLPKALDKAQRHLLTATSGRLTIKYNRKAQVISIAEILYLERQMRTTIIRTHDNNFRTADKLEILLSQLPTPPFFRCHRSYVVNLMHVKSHSTLGFNMVGSAIVPISRTYTAQMKTAFHQYISAMV